MSIQQHRVTWRDIELEVAFEPIKWGVISHLQIKSVAPARAPLPITPTGYKSHYMPIGSVTDEDVVSEVVQWLDEAAQSKDWKAYEAASKQGNLFDLLA